MINDIVELPYARVFKVIDKKYDILELNINLYVDLWFLEIHKNTEAVKKRFFKI